VDRAGRIVDRVIGPVDADGLAARIRTAQGGAAR
jgi:hypothetical protein